MRGGGSKVTYHGTIPRFLRCGSFGLDADALGRRPTPLSDLPTGCGITFDTYLLRSLSQHGLVVAKVSVNRSSHHTGSCGRSERNPCCKCCCCWRRGIAVYRRPYTCQLYIASPWPRAAANEMATTTTMWNRLLGGLRRVRQRLQSVWRLRVRKRWRARGACSADGRASSSLGGVGCVGHAAAIPRRTDGKTERGAAKDLDVPLLSAGARHEPSANALESSTRSPPDDYMLDVFERSLAVGEN